MEETEKIKKQHVQLPNDMTKQNKLAPKDLLVYATIKKYMNKVTKECFPSLETLTKDSGYSINTIRKSIELLVNNQYISIRKQGRQQIYKFSSYKNFEPFSYDFLDSDLDNNEKAYILATQQHMITNQEKGLGKTTYTNIKLGELINMSPRKIASLDKSLENKGLLSTIKTSKKDALTGLMKEEKIFHLDALGQAVIWSLQNHEERIEVTENKVEQLEKQMKILLRENKNLKDLLNKNKDEEYGTFTIL